MQGRREDPCLDARREPRGPVDADDEPRGDQLDRRAAVVVLASHARGAVTSVLVRSPGQRALEGPAVLPGDRHGHGGSWGGTNAGRAPSLLSYLPTA